MTHRRSELFTPCCRVPIYVNIGCDRWGNYGVVESFECLECGNQWDKNGNPL